MVEVHYREREVVNPITHAREDRHTRAVFENVDAALGQVAYDLTQGLDPIGIFEHDPARSEELWDGEPLGKRYDRGDWVEILSRAELRRQAKGR